MNKQLSKLICLLILISLVISLIPASKEASGYSAKVTANILNVRSKAAMNSSIKFKLSLGTAVTVTKESKDWSYISYGKKSGWVASQYLSYTKPASLGTYYVTASSLNVRTKASTSSKVVTSVKKNASLTLLKKSGSWGQVKVSNGKTGWVSLNYLTTKKPASVPKNLGTYYVTASSLNVREKASTSSKIVTSVKKNASVTLLKKSGSWGQVKVSNGKTGWVSLNYLTTKKAASVSKNLGTYYVTASSLNVRAKASTSSKVVTSVKKNASVTLLKKSGNWGQIKLSNGKIGWVSLNYLTTKKPVSAQANLGIYYVTASSLNVRAKASTSSKIVTSVKKNASVTLLKKSGSWGQIKLSNGKTGWVSLNYLTTKKPVSAQANLGIYYVTASSLNVRAKASTSSKIVTSVKKNASVTLLKKSGSWGQIKLSNGKTGWVSLNYLTTKKPVSTEADLGTYYVTASSLNVREKASTSSKIITSVNKNSSVTLLKRSGSWGQVKVSNGKTGWVSLNYLTTKKPASTSPNPEEAYYTAARATIHKDASSKSSVVASVSKGIKVQILSTKNSFTQIKLPSGTIGWLASHLVTTKTVKGKTIVIDPGHGGQDAGAIGTLLKTLEKNINLSTANELAARLRQAGAKVVMTRSSDTYPTLLERAAISNKNMADAFISIHYNASISSSVRGIETFYHLNPSLASSLQQEIAKSTGLRNRGIKKNGFTVLYQNTRPAALVELGFLTNPTEERIISQSSYHEKAAQGMFNGLNVFFSK
ncbi:hypothetical protein CYL18_06040 [Pradoshia eiseniae]|uniref:SH3b domain-containing protein n=1 Tax=Pradoshia eiseniae TaxID=2064768 RepID=A0A2S7N2A7_9BACI|nr:SH3 domain-containing protein [Pradoshia eiseniae]PQD96159.1 hypothetical protein CYL18_06040 [Pradoshia eiseniae]